MPEIKTLYTFANAILTPLAVVDGAVVARYGARVLSFPLGGGAPVPTTHSNTPVGAFAPPVLDGYHLPTATQRVGEWVAGVAYKTPFRSNMAAVGWALHEPSGEMLVAAPLGFDSFLPQRLSLDGRYLAGMGIVAGVADATPARQHPGLVDLLTGEFTPTEGILGGPQFGPLAWGADRSVAAVVRGAESYSLVVVTGWEG